MHACRRSSLFWVLLPKHVQEAPGQRIQVQLVVQFTFSKQIQNSMSLLEASGFHRAILNCTSKIQDQCIADWGAWCSPSETWAVWRHALTRPRSGCPATICTITDRCLLPQAKPNSCGSNDTPRDIADPSPGYHCFSLCTGETHNSLLKGIYT